MEHAGQNQRDDDHRKRSARTENLTLSRFLLTAGVDSL